MVGCECWGEFRIGFECDVWIELGLGGTDGELGSVVGSRVRESVRVRVGC